MWELVDGVKKRQNKRMNDADAEKLFKIQDHLYEFVKTVRLNFLNIGESSSTKTKIER